MSLKMLPFHCDYALKPENALKNAEYVSYSTPNNAGKEMLPEETKEDKSFYPDAETMNHLEVYEKFDRQWTGISTVTFSYSLRCIGSRSRTYRNESVKRVRFFVGFSS